MAAFKLNLFSGIFPKVPESLLPERTATVAENCDFAYGDLRNTKDGFLLNNMFNAPRSIYTDDGLTFYTWATDVDAVRSPLVSDPFNRMYFTDGAQMKVANRASTSINGGPPGSSYYVGVPRPSVAPSLSIKLPDVTDASKYSLVFKMHYEYAGIKYQEQTITPTNLTGGKYQFTPATMSRQVSHATRDEFPATGESGVVYKASDTGTLYTWSGSAYVTTTNDATPTQAFLVLRITATLLADSSQVFDIYTDNSSFTSTGGLWSVSMANDANAATFTATLVTSIKEADKETRAYVFVYRNTYNESGPPSSATQVTTSPIVDVTVTVTKDAITNYAPIKAIDVYRTPTGSTLAEYYFVGSVDVLSGAPGTFTFTDNVKAELLNETLLSTYYFPPPPGLVGLMSLPNGILCAWKGNELWFSEAYKPWAWNPNYVKPLHATVVGGIVHGSGAVITTVKSPYMVSGVSPDSMTASRINVDQAGVSKWSIAVVDGACLYASNDGLVVINGGSASLAQGQRFFTREVWRARYSAGLSGMRFSVWDGRLIVFHGAGAFTPFMIRTDEADGTMTDLPSFSAACAFVSALSDQCYFALNTGIYQFNGGAALPAVWQSREVVLDRPCNFGIGQALVEGSWSVEFWAYSPSAKAYQLKHTKALITGQETFRLPSGYEADRYKIKITGTGRFRELRVAQTARELASL